MAETGAAKIIDAFANLIEVLVASLGREATIACLVAFAILSLLWRLYNDRRKDRIMNAVLQEKDRTIQRLAESERNYRILFFKEKAGWTDEQIERFVIKGDFKDGPDARRALEGKDQRTTDNTTLDTTPPHQSTLSDEIREKDA